MEYAAEMASYDMIYTYVPSLMKIGTRLRNFRGGTAGNTDGRDLCRTALRWLK
jgi:hypothetical protein